MTTKTRMARGVFVLVSAALLMVSVTGWAASERYLAGLSQVEVFGNLGGGPGWNGDPINILLVGSDDRSGLTDKQRNRLRTGPDDFSRRTDTMMLIHLGSDLENVSVVSIPRDSLVTIPAHTSTDGQEISERKGKINSAFSTGGPAATVATVQRATGVEISHYVEVNFKGFLSMVNAVDGVPVCLSKPLQDEKSGLDLPAGMQTIRGKQALAYVRARYIDNDFGRAGRQQKFVAAMIQKVTSSGILLNPFALNSFVDAAISSVTTDERLGRDDIAALAVRVADIELANVEFTTVPVKDGSHFYNGQSTVLWDEQAATTMFNSLSNDEPLPKPQVATTVAVSPGDIKFRVISSNSQLSTDAQMDLSAVGYEAEVVAGTGRTSTTVRYDPIWQRSLATVRASLPEASYEEVPGLGGTFELLVADDYTGLHPVKTTATAIESKVRSAKDDICSE